jgi:hypothetical protein
MSHDIGRERDYPVIDRAPDDDDDRDERIEQDAEAEYHPDHTDRPGDADGDALADDPDRKDVAIDLRDDLDAGDPDRRDGDPDRGIDGTDLGDDASDRNDGVVDGLPGDTPEDHHDRPIVPGTTTVPVDDIAAQDAGVVPVVPPATDDADAVPPAGAEVAPAVVPVAVGVDTDGTASPAASGTASTAEGEDAWRELQLTFVDDPAAAVRDAADLLEKAVADLRQQYEGSDSTEDLRTAFRKYRDVYRGLR